MFSPDQHSLLDFGNGRKLERFGPYVLDRPCPAAKSPKTDADAWTQSAARFVRGENGGRWHESKQLPPTWNISHGSAIFELKRTEAGHLGVFVEQAANWERIARAIRRRKPCRVLNLFAYTGGSTLVAAASGAEVIHVDASRSAVTWAKRNAALSGLAEAPIRWIVEDALKFVRREARRGSRYDAIILDPPSYGHGPKGESWKLERHLMPLLQHCRTLLADNPALLLLTSHTPGFGPAELSAMLTEAIFGHCAAGVDAKQLSLVARDGRKLRCGVVAHWP